MASKAQLENAVAEAAAELDEQLNLSEKAEKAPEVELEAEDSEESEDEDSEEEESEEEDTSDQEAIEAKRLYNALKDPKAAPMILAALAQNMGLTLNQPKTEKQEQKDVKSVQALLKEGLGKEYEFLADRLGPAIEKVLDQEREQLNERFVAQEKHRIEMQVISSTDKLLKDTKGDSKKYETRMTTLAEEIPIGNMSMDTYIRRLYNVAKSEAGGRTVNNQRNNDRIRQNANNASERLRGTSTRVEPQTKIPDKKMNLRESVNFALDTLANAKR